MKISPTSNELTNASSVRQELAIVVDFQIPWSQAGLQKLVLPPIADADIVAVRIDMQAAHHIFLLLANFSNFT